MKKPLEIALHLLFWLFCLWLLNQNFAFETLEVYEVNGERREVLSRDYQAFYFFIISLLAKAALVYGTALWLLPANFQKKDWMRLAMQFLLLLLSVMALEAGMLYIFDVVFSKKSFGHFLGMWRLNLLFYLFFTGISVAYFLGKNWWRNEQIRQQLAQEKLASELNFLKSQINPHFLFNTLNNLYALAERHGNDDLSKGITGLSGLMRYMLHDGRAERVPLEKEVHFIESLIEMQQLRLGEDDDVLIAFDVEGELKNREIAPLILLPFVENAFKHGIRFREACFIKINLKTEANALIFSVKNSVFEKTKNVHDEPNGIGLKNVKRRLELLYHGRHKLEIREEGSTFSVRLTITGATLRTAIP